MPDTQAGPPAGRAAKRRVPRAETVGSLLRPPELRNQFAQVYHDLRTPSPRLLTDAQRGSWEELERVADAAVTDAVQRQIDLGLDVITDGEMRRASFTHSLVDALAGFEDSDVEFAFTNAEGETMVPPSGPLVGHERVRKVDNPAAREARYLRSLTDYPIKVTFPAASYWYCEPVDLDQGVCTSQAEFVSDIVKSQRELIGEVISAGARHIQMDWPSYVMAIDSKWREHLPGTSGRSLPDLMEELIAVDNAVIERLPDNVTVAMHICRGNYRSMWMTEGSLEPIGEQLFHTLNYDRLLLECDDPARTGGFETLRRLPEAGPVVVLGVVSTKTADVEEPGEVRARVEAAARYAPIDRLALSPQCGFAATWEGNDLPEENQWKKIGVIVQVADELWGR